MSSSKSVFCGKVKIGGGAPVSVQSMTNTDTRDVSATLDQIQRLADAGADIVRCTVPDTQAAEAFGIIKKQSPVPLVADIHFDYKLAIAAIEAGADKIRINPGNIGSRERVKAVLDCAKDHGIPVRIGVNSGSLEKDLITKYGGVCAEAICESALNAAAYAQDLGFEDIVVSLKCSDVQMNHKAHKLFVEKCGLPLHIGLTEAGFGEEGMLKSTAALSALLLDGIGDTMRVSLTGDPVQEVVLANKILRACGIKRPGIEFVSCPTCGRTQVDLAAIAEKVKILLLPFSEKLEKEGRSIRVSVMGCVVNGPGEAGNSDFGIACGKNEGVLFRNGKVVEKLPESMLADALVRLVEGNI
ncbi:MAG: flavodoxin-dependent (E)-4-hydroxy-3-methylbut-2-enyl-diphosphate synthase [Firmicutes bacterium]|nr:flavodoxin-dependent (E)-4-hydroxy-3-methylbut-2-enyl-diphosphate synthase [Bacillota bacterium]MBR6236293.1 flavodoxin-dependent (E)-4-hydroxy-3-methylbut-2-enyl-diphosphate synthase [Bacillota bacterium]